MKHLALVALCGFLLIALAGCGSVPRPEVEYYLLDGGAVEPVAPEQRVGDGVVVLNFKTAAAYAGRDVAYRSNPYRISYDEHRRWAEPPGELVAGEFARCLRESKLFDEVFYGRTGMGSYTINGTILEMSEWDADGEWCAVLKLDLAVHRVGTLETLGVMTEARVRAEKTGDFTDMAEAMSEAVTEVCRQFVEAAARGLKR